MSWEAGAALPGLAAGRSPPRHHCSSQDLATLDVSKLTPLSPEVISRQATINIGAGRAWAGPGMLAWPGIAALLQCGPRQACSTPPAAGGAHERAAAAGGGGSPTPLAGCATRPRCSTTAATAAFGAPAAACLSGLSSPGCLPLPSPHCHRAAARRRRLAPAWLAGTIGHVAHGKSTVVKAISGVQTVRFKNELERNITIKLGYANAKIYKRVAVLPGWAAGLAQLLAAGFRFLARQQCWLAGWRRRPPERACSWAGPLQRCCCTGSRPDPDPCCAALFARPCRCADPRCPRPACYKAYGSSKEDSPKCDVPGERLLQRALEGPA